MSEGARPLTRQRSKWAPRTIPTADFLIAQGAVSVEGWERNVHDGLLRVIVADEPPAGGWHLSISHAKRLRGGEWAPGRYPSWDEITDARYEFLPLDLDFVMHLPPPGEYVALHDTTFHLHEHPERKPQ